MPLNKFKFDSIQGNSNIHCDIYRILNAFLLNLTFTQKSPTESPQTHGDSSQSPYPSNVHTQGLPQRGWRQTVSKLGQGESLPPELIRSTHERCITEL